MNATTVRERGIRWPLETPSPSAEAGAAAQPRNPFRDLVPSLFETPLQRLAEDLFRRATKEQLIDVAAEAARVDRDKALVLSALLAWYVAGDRPELTLPKNEFLAWVFVAEPDELRALGARLVELSFSGSALLASAITDAALAHDRAMQHRGNGRA